MTARHCPGCRGYAHGRVPQCPGIDTAAGLDGEFTVPDVVPPLSFRDRMRVLAGRAVLMGVTAGPVGEPFRVVVPGEEDWKT